jgi:hypothetical protein
MRLQQGRIVLQGQAELAYRGRRLLLALPNEAKVEVRLCQPRLKPQRLFERGDCTLQLAILGKPDAHSVIDSCGRRTGWRVRSRCRLFAGVWQLRRGPRADK